MDYFQTLLLAGWIELGSVFQSLETLTAAEFVINFEKSDTSFKNIFEAYSLQKSKVNYDLFKFLIIFSPIVGVIAKKIQSLLSIIF